MTLSSWLALIPIPPPSFLHCGGDLEKLNHRNSYKNHLSLSCYFSNRRPEGLEYNGLLERVRAFSISISVANCHAARSKSNATRVENEHANPPHRPPFFNHLSPSLLRLLPPPLPLFSIEHRLGRPIPLFHPRLSSPSHHLTLSATQNKHVHGVSPPPLSPKSIHPPPLDI